MSHISQDDVRKIAALSRLELNEDEISMFAKQLEDILAYIEKLSEVDVEGVEPFLNAAADGNVSREDQDRPSLDTEDALANAPQAGGGFFKVPQVT